MMKVAAFLVAMTTVAGFASCSNDESINDEFIGAVSNNMTPSVASLPVRLGASTRMAAANCAV